MLAAQVPQPTDTAQTDLSLAGLSKVQPAIDKCLRMVFGLRRSNEVGLLLLHSYGSYQDITPRSEQTPHPAAGRSILGKLVTSPTCPDSTRMILTAARHHHATTASAARSLAGALSRTGALPRVPAATTAAAARARLLSTARECDVEALQGSDAGIFVLTLNRPAAKNALGRTLLAQFRESIQALRFNDAVEGVFCAGADLKERATMQQSEVAAFVHSLRASFSELEMWDSSSPCGAAAGVSRADGIGESEMLTGLGFESLPMPTIAAIDGFALGGGLELALGADMRVAGEKAKIGLPETKLAIIPGAGGTQRLPRLIGESKAKELIFTARVLLSREAHDYGIVNYAVEGSALPKALDLARAIIPNGPVALRMTKLAVNHGAQLDLASGLAFEQTCYAGVIPTEDRLEGLAAFREKRAPVYKGR
ncbi:hypothetical protein HK105_204489 [Polyrhizophydium stewartii]|uniref:Enoyl-CoA hydratase n=1 Tax=Polyrhizophydium stewartii TaxID=2732419 RepID=A0ABR4N978_9FUNG